MKAPQVLIAQRALFLKTASPRREDHYAEGTPARNAHHPGQHKGMFARGRFRRPLRTRKAIWAHRPSIDQRYDEECGANPYHWHPRCTRPLEAA